MRLTLAPGASTGVRSNAQSCLTGRSARSSDGSCASLATRANTKMTSAPATVPVFVTSHLKAEDVTTVPVLVPVRACRFVMEKLV